MKHLRFKMHEAPNEHPQQVMRDLGITYSHSTPQSMGDQWWFWNCQGYPEPLPPFLDELTLDPRKLVGWGLSKKEAEEIAAMAKD